MFGTILSWLTGGIIGKLGDQVNKWHEASLTAANDHDRIEAEKQRDFFKGQMELAIAAAKYDRWWSTRELIGKCVAIFVFKIMIYDTVLALGVTPDPGPLVKGIAMVVIGFYFGSAAVTDIGAQLSAVAMRKLQNK